MLSLAKLKDSSASLDHVQYLAKRNLEKSQVLSLANYEFINKFQNILLTGATGTGKSFLAQALARRAISLGYSVKYYRVTKLPEKIEMARLDGSIIIQLPINECCVYLGQAHCRCYDG